MSPIMGKLNDLAAEKGIPLDVQWELTYRCNLACGHCYVAGCAADGRKELSLEEIENILDQLAAAGTLFLTLTGGEALVRPDFFDILAAARRRTFAVILFSNGTLIDIAVARRLAAMGVVDVGISVYGATPEVHDSIVGAPGAFRKTMSAISNLRGLGVKVTLKSVIMKENFQQYNDLIALAEKMGLRYILDPIVSPRNDGSRDALDSRLDVDRIVELYRHPHFYPEGMQGPWEQGPDPTCYAGRNIVAVNPYGDVLPCLQFLVPMGNLRERSFEEIWREQAGYREMKNLTLKDLPGCVDCSLQKFCGRCPGLALLETGSVTKPCPVACVLAEARKRIHDLKNIQS